MNNNSIDLRSINSLLTDEQGQPTRFRIPAYQRGYRWAALQVTQLLDDIWEFIQTSEEGKRQTFYCLQPLVIKAHAGGDYEVVDGQQRLTTIYILLTYLKDIAAMLGKARFQLMFETRREANDPFLQNINLARADENVDYFFICEAYKAIEAWFSERDAMHKLKLLQHLLNDDEAGRNVKVIWFQLADSDNPVDAFTRLNIGKIPLTNDELIRALFLRGGGADAASLQLRIAYEWDQMEKGLQSDAFWYFLSNTPWKEQNRIGFLFDLVAQAYGIPTGAENDAYGIFYTFNERLKVPTVTAKSEWLTIKQTYLMLEEWFEDRVLYHLVGFLINERMLLNALRKLSVAGTKSAFEQHLRQEIYSRTIGGDLPDPLDEQAIRDQVSEQIETLSYNNTSHPAKIRSVLLLFNLATLLQNERSNLRFQFDRFKSESWDIEHVRSVTDDKPERHPDRQRWLHNCLGYLESQKQEGKSRQRKRTEKLPRQKIEEKLSKRIGSFLELSQGEATNDIFDPLYAALLDYFDEKSEGEAEHSIANLTLLDEHTNRSYKNAVFAVKRQAILDLDQGGIFVPLCTRNVFLKCYSPQVDNVMFWGEDDQESYKGAMITTLVDFFCGKGRGAHE